MLGKFEEVVLLSVMKSGDNSVPSEVYAALSESMERGKVPAFGALYTTLERLSRKGLLDVSLIPDDSGRDRKYYSINFKGKIEVKNAVNITRNLGGFALSGG